MLFPLGVCIIYFFLCTGIYFCYYCCRATRNPFFVPFVVDVEFSGARIFTFFFRLRAMHVRLLLLETPGSVIMLCTLEAYYQH